MTARKQLPPDMPETVRDDWHSAGRMTNHTIHTTPDQTEEGSPLVFLALETDRFPFSEHGYHGIVATRDELVEMARTILDSLE